MVSNKLYNNTEENRYWTLWEISIGSMVCFCCVVFLGLKLKWFRAQLRLGESPKNNSSAPVQGVGFKMKSNPDDFQVYKVISEFAPVTSPTQQKPQVKNPENKNISMNAENVKPSTNINQNAAKKPENKNVNGTSTTAENAKPSTNINVSKINKVENKNGTSSAAHNARPSINNNQNPPKKVQPNAPTTKPHSPKKPAPKPEVKPILKQDPNQNRHNNNTVNFNSDVTEISNPNDLKYSDLINNKQTSEEVDEYQQITKNPQQSLQIKNPLATRNFSMPVEDEDEWKIRVVDQKPKPQPKKEDNNDYFAPPNANMTSNMYSSQAASIFFAGQPVVPQPRARKFVEMDEDDIVSTGSQTSA